MANIGTIATSITFPVELWNEMERIRAVDELERSRFIQSAVRMHIKRIKKRDLNEFVDDLDKSEVELLKEILKKGA